MVNTGDEALGPDLDEEAADYTAKELEAKADCRKTRRWRIGTRLFLSGTKKAWRERRLPHGPVP